VTNPARVRVFIATTGLELLLLESRAFPWDSASERWFMLTLDSISHTEWVIFFFYLILFGCSCRLGSRYCTS
jgi:hypothetical protein